MDLGFEGNFTVFKQCLNLDINSDCIKKETSKDQVLLKKNNYRNIFANDINPLAKLAWSNYFKRFGYLDIIYKCESIVDIVKKYETGNYRLPEDIDIITGGFPCQDFSVAGKRLGFSSIKNHYGTLKTDSAEENRGNLYLWMKKTIEIIKPKMFIAENVRGLVSLKNVKDIIIKDFSEADDNSYLIVNPKVLLSAEYGVPQSRERIIFIGFQKKLLNNAALNALSMDKIPDKYDPYPPITHSELLPSNSLKQYTSSGSVLLDLKEPEESDDESQKHFSKAKFLDNKSQGQIEVDLSKISPTIRSEHHGNIEFRRLSVANGGRYLDELKKGYAQRRLTVRECARLQTFPDDYPFIFRKNKQNLSASEAYKLIGNAVPPLLAYHIAKRIEQNWPLYFEDKNDLARK